MSGVLKVLFASQYACHLASISVKGYAVDLKEPLGTPSAALDGCISGLAVTLEAAAHVSRPLLSALPSLHRCWCCQGREDTARHVMLFLNGCRATRPSILAVRMAVFILRESHVAAMT
jgi:hypothetical protein